MMITRIAYIFRPNDERVVWCIEFVENWNHPIYVHMIWTYDVRPWCDMIIYDVWYRWVRVSCFVYIHVVYELELKLFYFNVDVDVDVNVDLDLYKICIIRMNGKWNVKEYMN